MLERRVPWGFIALWTALNLLPAALAELTSDEGYYWFLSTGLQWGYYDHPPMLALLARAGTTLVGGELGVRLFNVLCSSASLVLLFLMLPTDPRRRRLAYLILLSIPLLNYLSILVFPDGPLLLFSLVFLWGYRRFLHREDAWAILLMGIAMGLMAYSKYHGALVVLFVVLSNPRLLRAKGFYAACALALVMFLPHLWWQYQHDFVTFHYHTAGRSRPFTLVFLMDFLAQQTFAIGPALIFVPFVVKVTDPFERALKFIAVGTLVFFLLSTIRGLVHIHWTSIALFPMVLLAVRYYSTRPRPMLYGVLALSAVAGLLLRLYLIYQIIPANHQGIDYYHDRDLWAEDVQALAGDDPVLFYRDFRQAGLYGFYAGTMGVALFPGRDRQSQYELWHYEDSLQAKRVTWVQYIPFGGDSLVTRMGQTLDYYQFPSFNSYFNLRLDAELPDRVGTADRDLRITVVIRNHRETAVAFPADYPWGTGPVLYAWVADAGGEPEGIALYAFQPTDSIPAHSSASFETTLPLGSLTPGTRQIDFGIVSHPQGIAVNSPPYTIEVVTGSTLSPSTPAALPQ